MKNKKSLKTQIDELSQDLGKETKKQDIINFQDVVLEKVIEIMDKMTYEKRKGEIRQRNDDEINSVYQRYLSLNKIETEYKNIDDYLDTVIEKIYNLLKQKKIKLNHDLFERGNFENKTNGNGLKLEFKTTFKNKIFLRVLYKLGIDLSKIQEYEEKLNPERMRKIPYLIYHIFDENINKTVLVCDQIGQATFIYEGIIEPSIFQLIEKGEEIDGKNPLKLVYNKKSFEKNIEISLNGKLTFEEKEEKIINEEVEISDEIEKLTKEELFEKLWNYDGRSEQESYEHFIGLTQKGISELKIGGNKVSRLKTISGINIDGVMNNPSVFQEWIEKVFEGKDIVRKIKEVIEKLTKEELFEKLGNYDGRNEQESYDHFMGLTQKGISELKIGGNKVNKLKTISGINIDGNIETPSVFQEWIEKVFEGKNILIIEKLTKEELFEKLWNYDGRSEQESYEHFIGLTQKGISDLEIGGNKVKKLKTISLINIDGNIKTSSGFQEWIEKVFEGKDIVRKIKEVIEKLTKEELFEKLGNYEGRSEQESYDHFMGLNKKGITELEIGGNKVNKLKTISGINIDGNIETPSVFQEWIEKVFEGKDIVRKIKEVIEKLTKEKLGNYEGRSEQESYDYFMGLTHKGIKDLEIGGNKVSRLKTISGINIDGNIETPSVFQEWIEKVFEGKDIVRKIKEVIEKLTKEELFEKLWNYDGRSEQESYDHFMGLTHKGIKDLEIGGNKVNKLKTISGINIDGNIQTSSGFQEWIEKVFEGKDIVRKIKEVIEKLTKEELFEKLWNYDGRSEQESYDHFMGLTQKGISELKIGGNKVNKLKTISGINIDGDMYSLSGFQEWIEKVFEGKDIVRKIKEVMEKLTKEELFEKLGNYDGRSEQESYDHFMGLTQKGISELKIGGNKVNKLKTISGINIDGNIQTSSGFQEWIEKVFEGKNILIIEKLKKEELFEKLWNYDGRSEQESYEHFIGLTQKGISDLEIGGNKVNKLKTISGINIDGNILTSSGFQEWIEKVFEGKDIVKKQKNLK